MRTEAPTPGPARAYGLFIGASAFPDHRYGDRPSVAESAHALAEVFADNGVWDLAQRRPALLHGHVTMRAAVDALAHAAQQQVDLLFVYIGCHGSRFQHEYGLQLALSDADFELFATHLQFTQVKAVLQRSTARLKLLLLDCCYADDSFLGQADVQADVLAQLDVAGVCTMVATEHRVEASARWRNGPYTAFAGALLEVLREGVAQAPPALTARHLHEAMKPRLRDHSMPRPGIRGDADIMPLFRNRHPQAAEGNPRLVSLGAALDIGSVDPATYAKTVAGIAAERGGTARIRGMLDMFVQRRDLTAVAEVVRAFLLTPDGGNLAAATLGSVGELRDEVELAALAHLLHDAGPDPLFAALREPAPRFTATIRRLYDADCAPCEALAGGLLARVAAPDGWSADRLVDLLDQLPPAPAGHTGPSPRGRLLAALSPDRVVELTLRLWSRPGRGLHHRIDAASIVEGIAGRETPRSLLDLATRLAGQDAAELVAVLMESGAAGWTARDLAELLRLTDSGPIVLELGSLLRTTVVRRRPPAFLAELLKESDGPQAQLLLTAAVTDGTVRDAARTLLVLRRSGAAALAEALAAALVEGLPVSELGALLGLLDSYGDREAVIALLSRVRWADAEAIATLVHELRAGGRTDLVTEVVRHIALGTSTGTVLHLSALLDDLDLAQEAAQVLRGRLDQAAAGSLPEALDVFREVHRPADERLDRVIRMIVRDCTVEQVYELTLWARGRLPGGEQTVIVAVVAVWSVSRIVELAERFTDTSYKRVGDQLFRQVVGFFGTSRTEGDAIAELILALGRRSDAQQWRDAVRELTVGLARRRDTREMMSLVARLLRERQYGAHRETVEHAVLAHFGWEDFVWLPKVHGASYLLAVLEIEMQALLSPDCVPADRFPEVVMALKDAGAGEADLRRLIGYVGRKRRIDRTDVIANLRGERLYAEAHVFTEGGSGHRPDFL